MALAEAIGAHAVAVFLVLLVALLLAAAALWAGLHCVVVPRDDSRLPPIAFLVLRLGLGFAIVVLGGMVFAEMAEALDAEEAFGRFDTALADSLRARLPRGVLQVFAWLTRLGDVATLTLLAIVVAALLLVRGRRRLALAWVLALAGNGALNRVLKSVFERVRPVHEHGFVLEPGWSFPSGHSSGSVVAYGMLAYVLLRHLPPRWHLPVLLAATAVAFTTGSSRVFLQVHYASDVLAGFASGLAWLTACIVSIELLRARRRAQR